MKRMCLLLLGLVFLLGNAGNCQAVSPQSTLPVPGEGFVFLGDSLTSCALGGGVGTCYIDILQQNLLVPIGNAAENASTSTVWQVESGQAPPFWPCNTVPNPSAYDRYLPLGQSKRWAVVMIMAGDSISEAQCPEGWAPPTPPDRFESNIRELVDRIWEDTPGLYGVLFAIPPHFQTGLIVTGALNDRIDLYAERLQAICDTDRRARCLPGLDLRDLLTPSDYDPSDILHPNAQGHIKMADRFLQVLSPLQ